MKKAIPTVLLALFLAHSLAAAGNNESAQLQSDGTPYPFISVGVGFGAGIFYPKAVNDYIAAATSHLTITTGFSEMITNYYLKGSFNVRPHKMVQVSPFAEICWAPKLILVDVGDSYYFSFTKITPGIAAKLLIPFASGRHAFFLSPALTFNILKFSNSEDSFEPKSYALGGKFHIGFFLNLRKIQLQPYAGYDRARGTGENGFEMNFSGAQIGIEIQF